MSYILVLDQGTHASRAIVFNSNGDVVEQTQQAVTLHQISHETIEQDADELLNSIHTCITQLNPTTLKKITNCCISTQRSTIVAWHRKTGEVFGPAISWQDRRSDEDLKQFKNQAPLIKNITGLPLSAHYGSGKIRWLLNHNSKVSQALNDNNLIIAPLVSFLLFHLLQNKPCLIDHSNAHRSLLFDLKTLDWSSELLELFNIPENILPACVPVQHHYGHLTINNIPVTAVCGDQSAAFLAQGKPDSNTANINIGTGAFTLVHCDTIPRQTDLLCGIAYSDKHAPTYLLEGTVNGAGSALSWAQKHYPVDDLFEVLPQWLNQISTPPVFINTVGGLGSPWWNSSVNAYFINDINLELSARYVAIIESIAFLIQHNLQAMQQLTQLKHINISGGLSQLDGLCQKIADLSQMTVLRSIDTEASARGGAWLASQSPDTWKNNKTTRFSPHINTQLSSRFQQFTHTLNRLK